MQVVELDMYGEETKPKSDKYIQSAEWELIKAETDRNAEKYECCEHPLADVTLELTMERKPLFYVFNLVLPCVIIITLVLLGFFLPPESGWLSTYISSLQNILTHGRPSYLL